MTQTTTKNRIAHASALIKAIQYDKRNTHDGYDYSSADSIFQATREAIAEAGLTLWIHEERFAIEDSGKLRASAKYSHIMIATFRVGFTAGHTPPDTWDRFERMTFPLPWINVQSRGALTTYVEKMYLRAKFQLPTGDLAEEVDHGHLDGTQAEGNQGRKQTRADAPPPSTGNGQATGTPGEWRFNDKGVLENPRDFENQIAAQRALWKFLKDTFGPQERTAERKKADQTRITTCWPEVRRLLAGEAQSGREYLETMITTQGFELPA